MKLKQICNHPAQFMHQAGETARFDPQADMKRSGKLARITEMLTETMTVGDRSLVFTQFKEMGRYPHGPFAATSGRFALIFTRRYPCQKATSNDSSLSRGLGWATYLHPIA